MLARNRFLLLVVVGGAVLAIISLSLQFCKLDICVGAQALCIVKLHLSEALALQLHSTEQCLSRPTHCCIHAYPLIAFPFKRPPFKPRQSRILCRAPINIQHQQWASGCSETCRDTLRLLWNVGVRYCVFPPHHVIVQHLL